MFGALGKRAEACQRRTPRREAVHHWLQQQLADARIPVVRMYRQWPKEADTAPVRCEARPHQRAIYFGGKCGIGVGAPAGARQRGIARECHRVGQAEKRPKGEPDDAVGVGDISLGKRLDGSVTLGYGRSPMVRLITVIFSPRNQRHMTRMETGRTDRLRYPGALSLIRHRDARLPGSIESLDL